MKRTFDGKNLDSALRWLSGVAAWLDKGKRYDVEIKQHRERRSIRANNYAWELMGQIAKAVGIDTNEVYHQMLVSYGTNKMVNGELYTASIPSVVDVTMKSDEYLYIHTAFMGESKVNGKLFNHFRVIKGSSEYDTKEMSVFIDGIVYEAKQLDIETRTPEDIASMCERLGA